MLSRLRIRVRVSLTLDVSGTTNVLNLSTSIFFNEWFGGNKLTLT